MRVQAYVHCCPCMLKICWPSLHAFLVIDAMSKRFEDPSALMEGSSDRVDDAPSSEEESAAAMDPAASAAASDAIPEAGPVAVTDRHGHSRLMPRPGFAVARTSAGDVEVPLSQFLVASSSLEAATVVASGGTCPAFSHDDHAARDHEPWANYGTVEDFATEHLRAKAEQHLRSDGAHDSLASGAVASHTDDVVSEQAPATEMSPGTSRARDATSAGPAASPSGKYSRLLEGKFTILKTKGKYSRVRTRHCQADAGTPGLEVVWKVCEGTPLLEFSKGTFKLLKGKLSGKTFVKLLPQNLLMTVKDDMTWANAIDDGSSSDSDIDIVQEAQFSWQDGKLVQRT